VNELRNEIINYIATHKDKTKTQIANNLKRNRNQTFDIINELVNDGIVMSVEGELSFQPIPISHPSELLPVYLFPKIDYKKIFFKWKGIKKLTTAQKYSIYETALANILPNLNMGVIFLWYSSLAHGNEMAKISEGKLVESRDSITKILNLVYQLDHVTSNNVKSAIKGRLLDYQNTLV